MTENLTSIHDGAPYAREVLSALVQRWPDASLLFPRALAVPTGTIGDQDFVHTVQFLNDNGFISYDAMLVGSEPEPRVLGAMITRRGQHLLGMFDKVGG